MKIILKPFPEKRNQCSICGDNHKEGDIRNKVETLYIKSSGTSYKYIIADIHIPECRHCRLLKKSVDIFTILMTIAVVIMIAVCVFVNSEEMGMFLQVLFTLGAAGWCGFWLAVISALINNAIINSIIGAKDDDKECCILPYMIDGGWSREHPNNEKGYKQGISPEVLNNMLLRCSKYGYTYEIVGR